jgi:DNA-binding NarL/FixJ family response regulator
MLTQPIQVALVDDHKLFRSGITSLINNFEGYTVLLEAGNGSEFINKLTPRINPDIALVDINMPVMDGFATVEWMKRNRPEIQVIILSMFADADKVLAFVKLGVKGYLLKDAEPVEFKTALDTVSNKEVYYPNFVTQHIINHLNPKKNGISHVLNQREHEFLKFAITDLTYKEIADKMCVSARTIDGYRDQLFERFSVKSRVGLVLYAIKNRMIDIDL